MSASRENIFSAVRRNLGNRNPNFAADYERISRDYEVAGKLSPEERLHLLEERLQDYGTGVYRCSPEQVTATISQVLAVRGVQSVLLPKDFSGSFLPPKAIEMIYDDNLSYAEIDRCSGVLTTCTVAIALTGTIILRHSADEGRRALTLIPDYHLCIVQAEQVVETVPEAIRRMEEFKTAPITTISGPSATSDIEMTRIKGVHGPRTLDVILVVS
ncbi:MAG TPA: LUD domain-containing protein [Terriglobales bacterium]